jgi:GTPase involved in cell partitioning and DNA repair
MARAGVTAVSAADMFIKVPRTIVRRVVEGGELRRWGDLTEEAAVASGKRGRVGENLLPTSTNRCRASEKGAAGEEWVFVLDLS